MGTTSALPHRGGRKAWAAVAVAVWAVAAFPAIADAKAFVPDRMDVMAALNQGVESKLDAVLNKRPRTTAAGYVVPVRRISELLCIGRTAGRQIAADCRYFADYGSRIDYHRSGFAYTGSGWRMISDQKVGRQPR